MKSTLLNTQSHHHRALDIILLVLLTFGLGVWLSGCGSDSDHLPSSNADLANLTLSEGTLSLAFAPTTRSYSASVPNQVETLRVIPTLAHSAATVQVNGLAVESGTPSDPIDLLIST